MSDWLLEVNKETGWLLHSEYTNKEEAIKVLGILEIGPWRLRRRHARVIEDRGRSLPLSAEELNEGQRQTRAERRSRTRARKIVDEVQRQLRGGQVTLEELRTTARSQRATDNEWVDCDGLLEDIDTAEAEMLTLLRDLPGLSEAIFKGAVSPKRALQCVLKLEADKATTQAIEEVVEEAKKRRLQHFKARASGQKAGTFRPKRSYWGRNAADK